MKSEGNLVGKKATSDMRRKSFSVQEIKVKQYCTPILTDDIPSNVTIKLKQGAIEPKTTREFNKANKSKLIKEYRENDKHYLGLKNSGSKSSSVVIRKQLESGIKKLFNALDLDHNGKITIEDLDTKSIIRQ